jgi:hypothetical protein
MLAVRFEARQAAALGVIRGGTGERHEAIIEG